MASLKSVAAPTVGVIIALATGFVGLVSFFSDLGASESTAGRISILVLAYVVGAGVVGALLPRAWYLASIAAWGPVVFGVLGLVAKLSRGGPFPHWSLILETLVMIPAACLVFGYGGSRLRRRLSSRTAVAA